MLSEQDSPLQLQRPSTHASDSTGMSEAGSLVVKRPFFAASQAGTLNSNLQLNGCGTLEVEFSKQEYWSGWPFPSSGDLSDPGIDPKSAALQVDSFRLSQPGNPMIDTQYIISKATFLWNCVII